jgi:hypothetical protein
MGAFAISVLFIDRPTPTALLDGVPKVDHLGAQAGVIAGPLPERERCARAGWLS